MAHLRKLKTKKHILNLIIILVCGIINGQVQIKGTVLSEMTGKIPESTVYVKELKTKQPLVQADSLGQFEIGHLEPNKEYLIEISGFGFDKQTFPVKTNDGNTSELFLIKADCGFDAKKAETDWNNGNPRLLLFGSIAPIANSKSDIRFENKYKIKYYDFGCTPPAMDCLKLYNERIFELMDKKYGKIWRQKVRKDVEYLN